MHHRSVSLNISFVILLLATLLLAGSTQSASGHPGTSTGYAAGPSANLFGRRQSVDSPFAGNAHPAGGFARGPAYALAPPSANPLTQSADSLTAVVSAQAALRLADGMALGEHGLADSVAPQQQAENVEFVGQIGGVTYAVALQGNYAYIGVGPRLVILDVSDPAQPQFLGRTAPLPSIVEHVAVAEGYAYVADGEAGLRIINVGDPAAPAEVGFFDTPDEAKGVAVAGGLAYVADYHAGLRIIDVSNPAAPSEVGLFDTVGRAFSVAMAGGYAYVADWNDGGLRIIDVGGPAAPAEVGFFDTPGGAIGVTVAGSYAYVADGDEGLRIIDVSNPATPAEAGFFDTLGAYIQAVAVAGSYAYLADGSIGGLRIIDVSNPTVPAESSIFWDTGFASGVAVAGSYAYVATGYDGLHIINVGDPVAPAQAAFFDTPGFGSSVSIAGGYAYLAAYNAGLQIIDVGDPAAPARAAFLETPGSSVDVAVAGGYAYLADLGHLRIIDVGNPVAPAQVGFFDTEYAQGVAVAGSYAYVADAPPWGDSGLRIIDANNPAAPAQVDFFDTPGDAWGVTVAGSFAYVAAGSEGLRVIDVSNPAAPAQVGFFDTPGDAWGVTVAGSFAYVAAGSEGLRVIDVSNPAAPAQVGFFDTPGDAWGVTVAGSFAYVAAGSEGLRVIDVSNPAAPAQVGFFDTPGWAYGVTVAGGYAFVADWKGGLFILRYTGSLTTPTPSSTRTPTPSPTPSATSTRSSTPTRTATNPPTQTKTLTPTPTVTPTPTLTSGDPYEPDDTCDRANAIPTNGDSQEHNFHTLGDPDWLRFQATAGTDYIVSALHIGDNAHPIIRLYDVCDKDPFADSSDTFSFDQIITFRAERSGLYYLKLTHRDESAYGEDTAYQVSVRPVSTGAAIIAGGRLYPDDDLQPQITFMTERAYQLFRQAGYADDDIYYTSADPTPPPHMDAPSRPANLRYAIENWAPQHTEDGEPLFLYLTNHGEREFFFLDTGQYQVTPEDLDAWLLDFEAQRPHSPVVMIIEACFSGSFITPLGSLSRPGRIIVTATGDNNLAYVKPAGEGGAYFSDAFLDALARNYDLWQSYQIARQVVREGVKYPQTPWIDGNGNGVPFPLDADDEGVGRSLGLGRGPGLSGGQPPFIERPQVPQPAEGSVRLSVRVLDENPAGLRVWMMVTRPSTPPPSAPPGYITPISHAERVDLVYNPATGKFEVEFTFYETGTYQFVFNAEDAGGQRAQSVTVFRTTTYLPLVGRQ